MLQVQRELLLLGYLMLVYSVLEDCCSSIWLQGASLYEGMGVSVHGHLRWLVPFLGRVFYVNTGLVAGVLYEGR